MNFTARLLLSAVIFASASTGFALPAVAVNAGGGAYTAQDGTEYAADYGFTNSRTFSSNQAIENTEDDVLYQSERWGTFDYSFELPNGDYKVTLQLAEVYFSDAGRRVFTVGLEGKELINNLDLAANFGRYYAQDLVLPVTVEDGELNISFLPQVNNAKVSAIKVEAVDNTFQVFGDSFFIDFAAGPQVFDVLRSAEGDNLRLTNLRTRSGSLSGTVSLLDDNKVLYIPGAGLSGFDVFSFDVTNGFQTEEDITVFIYDAQ